MDLVSLSRIRRELLLLFYYRNGHGSKTRVVAINFLTCSWVPLSLVLGPMVGGNDLENHGKNYYNN